MKSGKRNIARTIQIVSALLFCAAVALLASRTNRAPAVSLDPPSQIAVFEEVVPDLSVDMRTLQRALFSLQSATKTELVIDPPLWPIMAREEASAGPPVFEHFRNVRLGVLLARLLDDWENALPLECRVQGSKLLFCKPGSPHPHERRAIDLRAFKNDWLRWDAKVMEWGGKPSGPVYGSGLFSSMDDPGTTCVLFTINVLGGREYEYNINANWAGWAVIDAPPESHHRFEQFQTLWVQAASARQGTNEISFHNHGDLPELTARWNSPAQAAAAAKQMNAIIQHVNCKQTPLHQFIESIAESTGVNTYVDWHSMAGGAAVGADTPITLDLKNVPAAAALQTALDQCHRTAQPLGFVCVDGILKISIESRLGIASIRVYDVRDLIEYAMTQSRRNGLAAKDVMVSLAPQRPSVIPEFGITDRDAPAADALRAILFYTAQESWPYPSQINYFAGRFAVNTTPANHERIVATLAAMRALAK